MTIEQTNPVSGEMTFDLVRELLGRMDGAEARFQAGRGLHESRVICREDAQDRFARQAIPLTRLALSALARAEAAEAEVERLQRQVIQERHDERTAIQAQIDALVTELEGVDAQKDWALARSLDNLIDALMAKKDVLHRIADWQAIAAQDRRRAALARPAAAEAGGGREG